MNSATKPIVIVLACLVATAAISTANAGKLYWSNTGFPRAVQRADLDGSNIETLVEGFTRGIAIDPINRKMYWAHFHDNVETQTLRKSHLDGSGMQILADLHGLLPFAIALHPEGGDLFIAGDYFESCAGIRRYDLDGSNGTPIVPGKCVRGLAIDRGREKLYWTELGGIGAIRRSHLNGSSVETVIETVGTPFGIALDLSAGKVYWTESYPSPSIRSKTAWTSRLFRRMA